MQSCVGLWSCVGLCRANRRLACGASRSEWDLGAEEIKGVRVETRSMQISKMMVD